MQAAFYILTAVIVSVIAFFGTVAARRANMAGVVWAIYLLTLYASVGSFVFFLTSGVAHRP